MSTNLDAAFPLVHHNVPPGLALGDASWPRLGLQLGWVVMSHSLAILGCSAFCATRQCVFSDTSDTVHTILQSSRHGPTTVWRPPSVTAWRLSLPRRCPSAEEALRRRRRGSR